MANIRVGGFEPMSLCDWPGEIVATIFCQGCPWNCAYCHNPHLLPAKGQPLLDWSEIVTFLETRRGLLDGVVFSGGEPTLQRGLPEAIRTVRAMGFRVGVHSAGPYPTRLAAILPLVDWVGFDVKAPLSDYDRITRTTHSAGKALASLRHLLASGVDYQVRTTVHPALLDEAAMARLRAELDALGVKQHKIQAFRAAGCADPALVAAVAG